MTDKPKRYWFDHIIFPFQQMGTEVVAPTLTVTDALANLFEQFKDDGVNDGNTAGIIADYMDEHRDVLHVLNSEDTALVDWIALGFRTLFDVGGVSGAGVNADIWAKFQGPWQKWLDTFWNGVQEQRERDRQAARNADPPDDDSWY